MINQHAPLLSIMGQLGSLGEVVSAGDVAAAWLKIMRKFTPLIGANSVMLIFERSLDTHLAQFPWLPVLTITMQAESAIGQLRNSMTARGSDEIVAAHQAVLTTFIDLVTTLIGSRLTVQFLRAAFPADAASGTNEENPDDRQT